jgi:glycosyltransferase involved in cell wall biosynthesis
MTGPAATPVYIVALRNDEATGDDVRSPQAGVPTVALVPWGDVFHDFLDGLDVSLESFRDDFTGSWMFGYASALGAAGVRTLLVCPTTRVREPYRAVHGPTGAGLLLLPAGRAFAALRAHALPNRLDGRRSPTALARAAAAHVAPYAGTPPVALARLLRRERPAALLCQEYEDPRFDVCVGVGRALRIPVYATFQGADYQLSRLERPLRPLSLRGCAGLVIGAGEEAERVRRRYGFPAERIGRIPNPIDPEVWRPVDPAQARAELELPDSATVVAWHGQVQVRRKGLDVLLEAWRLLTEARPTRDLRLVLLGAGEDAAELRRLVDASGAPGIRLLDEWVHDRDRIRAVLSASDVYAFPSRHEGLPVAPLEALACGLPVVGADAQGVRDVVGDCGSVVPRDDPTALADALGKLLDDDRSRTELSLRARSRVEDSFALGPVGARLRAFLVDGRNS